MMERWTSREEAADAGKVRRMQPKESDFAGRPGYKRKYRPDGSYEWKYSFKPNEGGKPTKAAMEVQEMLAPSLRADADRVSTKSVKEPREALKDQNGGMHYIHPALAEAASRRNGWSPRLRAGGANVERGVEGDMLFRWEGSFGWQPMGVRCLGRPFKGRREVPKRGIYLDPDGQPWRWVAGEWRRT